MDTDEFIALLTGSPAQIPLAADSVLEDHGQSMVYRGRQTVAAVLRAYFGGGFSDGSMRTHGVLSSRQAVVVAFTFRGRQDGAFMGIPATGRQVSVPMVLFCRFAGQQVRHIAWYYDAGTLLRQLGLASYQVKGVTDETH